MQAIQVKEFGGAEVLEYVQVDVPPLGSNQVLIDVKAAGVNPVDTYIRSGTYAIKPPLPYTPGLDAAGTVEAVGKKVTGVRPGDRVYCMGSVSGTYAEKVVCEQDQVHPLPDTISFEQGAALGIPYATAYRALHHKVTTRTGQFVLIHGASGAVGLAALQIARNLGLRVLGTAGSPEGRDLVQSQGAEAVFDHHDPTRLIAIPEQTEGRGPDLILEMLANVNLALDLELLAPGGSVVVIGNRGSIEINPRLLMGKEATVKGMVLMNATAEEMSEIHAGIAQGLTTGTMNPVVAKTLPLPQAATAHRDVIDSPHAGKICLTV